MRISPFRPLRTRRGLYGPPADALFTVNDHRSTTVAFWSPSTDDARLAATFVFSFACRGENSVFMIWPQRSESYLLFHVVIGNLEYGYRRSLSSSLPLNLKDLGLRLNSQSPRPSTLPSRYVLSLSSDPDLAFFVASGRRRSSSMDPLRPHDIPKRSCDDSLFFFRREATKRGTVREAGWSSRA